VLVDYFSRDGSTVLMRLLATSPQIAVEPRDTHELRSYELRYFAYLWGWASLLDAERWPRRRWNDRALSAMLRRQAPALVGPPPWLPRALLEAAPEEQPMSRRCFDLAWAEFSRRAARLTRIEHAEPDADVRYYAEKHLNSWELDLDRLPPLRILAVLRDPRDTYVSMSAFDRRRGAPGFGRQRTVSEEEFLAGFIERQRARLRWIAGLLDDSNERIPVVRYEDLVRDLPGVAGRLEHRLGVELDPTAVLADRELRTLHVTAGSPEESIGRWRRELSPGIAHGLEMALGSELRAVGLESSRRS
jgi:Sulfotransferase family